MQTQQLSCVDKQISIEVSQAPPTCGLAFAWAYSSCLFATFIRMTEGRDEDDGAAYVGKNQTLLNLRDVYHKNAVFYGEDWRKTGWGLSSSTSQ